jgi:hypothetical protein
VAQGVGPEFKPQYCKKIKIKKTIARTISRGFIITVKIKPYVRLTDQQTHTHMRTHTHLPMHTSACDMILTVCIILAA